MGIQTVPGRRSARRWVSQSGFALVLRSLTQSYIDSGRLIAPFDGELPIEQAHYLLQPRTGKRPSPEVLFFRQWLLETARR